MSKKELTKYEVINKVINENLKQKEAAKLLELCERQIRRLKKKVKAQGAEGLIHGNRDKPGHNKLDEKEVRKIKKIMNDKYYDFYPTHASEKLAENHGIKRDPKTIRKIMIEEGLWKERKSKKKEHREWRQRRSHYGELQQFDGSDHDWLEGRYPKCTLLLSVDDATNKITYGKFDEHEGVFPVFGFWREYLLKNGKPVSIYLDRFSTYKMTQKTAIENPDTETQFQRAMRELRIEPISAYSAEAKGRVETTFGTLQNRLIKEMRLRGISNPKDANKFLIDEFIPWFNAKYGLEPRSKPNLHVKLDRLEKSKLNDVLCRHEERTVQNDFTISYKNHWYQITQKQCVTVCKRDKVVVYEYRDGSIKIKLRNKQLDVTQILKQSNRQKFKQSWVIPASIKESNFKNRTF